MISHYRKVPTVKIGVKAFDSKNERKSLLLNFESVRDAKATGCSDPSGRMWEMTAPTP